MDCAWNPLTDKLSFNLQPTISHQNNWKFSDSMKWKIILIQHRLSVVSKKNLDNFMGQIYFLCKMWIFMPVKVKILHAYFPLINHHLKLGECISSSWWNLTWKNAQKRITESRLSKWQLTNCEKFAPDLSPERNSLSRLVMEAEQRKKETADWASAVRQVRKRARCTS
jgi:hypothetical protein